MVQDLLPQAIFSETLTTMKLHVICSMNE